ncbi:deoxyribonuclease V [Haliscomenobacter sp.]|uniref:deoxyribonuclease V n=1 Tax=Haliscomenobacter sp. TaxID=2717303 RepID=UPI0035941EE3
MNNNLNLVSIYDLDFSSNTEKFYLQGLEYTGFVKSPREDGIIVFFEVQNGLMKGVYREYNASNKLTKIGLYNELRNGYFLDYSPKSEVFTVFDMDTIVELIKVDSQGNRVESYNIKDKTNIQTFRKYNLNGKYEDSEEHLSEGWKRQREENASEGYYGNNFDVIPYYELQNELQKRVQILESNLEEQVKFIAGADVAYDEREKRMVGAIIVLNAETLCVEDQAYYELQIDFPYLPGLFSFREVPPLVAAFKKLTIKPDLIICDGHGIAHPKGIGMASHLGIELDIPTIGCAKTRLIGGHATVGSKRGDYAPLVFNDKEVGRVLRTQDHIKPLFVSVGHKISIDSACKWVLKLCTKYRLPETTRHADALARKILNEITEINYPDD